MPFALTIAQVGILTCLSRGVALVTNDFIKMLGALWMYEYAQRLAIEALDLHATNSKARLQQLVIIYI